MANPIRDPEDNEVTYGREAVNGVRLHYVMASCSESSLLLPQGDV